MSEDLVDTSSFESQAIARVDNTDFNLRSRSKRMESTSGEAGAWSIGASKINVTGVPPGSVIPISGNTVTLNLVDGGSGDGDGFANGVILDPGGIRLPVAGEDSGGGGGGGSSGCFISIISPEY